MAHSPLYRLKSLLPIIAVAMLASCIKEKEAEPVVFYGQQFYPLGKGVFWERQIDTVFSNILANPSKRSGRYYEREVVGDTLLGSSGEQTFRTTIYRRADTTQPWQIEQFGLLVRRGFKIIKEYTEGPVVKLVLPFRHGQRWNGNEYLPDPDNSIPFQVRYLGNAELFGASFDSTAQVIEAADSSLLSARFAYSYYCPGKGPVAEYRRETIFQQFTGDTIPDTLSIQRETIFRSRLVRFGKL